jgi:V8-like Glu-specific endopeptidase
MPIIRVNRESVDDRFSVLGFTVRTESPLFEVGIATDPALFRPENRGRRSRRNFYSSRSVGAIRARRGEAAYLVPPDVLANFVGQSRLYFGLATYRENSGGVPDSVQAPTEGHMYVDLSGLTERGLRRLAGRPSGSGAYGASNGHDPSLDWGGDAQPPLQPQAQTPAARSGNGKAATATPAPATSPAGPYDDGFGEFPPPKAAPAPAPSGNGAAAAPAAAVTSQGLARRADPRQAPTSLTLGANDFAWPPAMAEGNDLVKAFVEAYNARLADGVRGDPAPDPTQYSSAAANSPDARAREETLRHLIPRIASELQSGSGGSEVSRAILQLTTAVSLQVLDQVRSRLPPTLYQLILAGEPAPEQTPTVPVPRTLTFLSRRIGMFMAWVDVAIQQATNDTRERLNSQKQQWESMLAFVDSGATMLGLVPGLGEAMTMIGLAAHGVIQSQMPNFDGQAASFDAAMRVIRRAYSALATTVLKGLIANALGQRDLLDSAFLHPDVQAILDAHAAYASLGWEEELAFLGYAPAGARAQALRAQGLGRPSGRAIVARAQEIITPFYDQSDPMSALTCQDNAFSLAREEWFMGVADTTQFPHSAICQLRMTAPNGSRYIGTGFYIGSDRILTCAHNLQGMASVAIIPGRSGATKPFGECTVASSSWRIAPAYTGSGNWANDLAVIDGVPLAAPNGQWFGFLNATPSDRMPIVVCGYAKQSVTIPELTQAIDGDAQHLHGGYASNESGLETLDYALLTLKGNSGSPVYHLSDRGAGLEALVCAVHVTGEPAARGLNRGCFITPTKMDWIDGRATAFALAAQAQRATRGTAYPVAMPGRQAAARQPLAHARTLIIGPEDVEQAQRYAPQWADLFNWSVPDWIPGNLAGRDMSVQRIADAVGALNLDRYEVRITSVPSGYTDVTLLEYVRTHLNDFLDTDNSEFIPYASGDDDVKWTSASPVGTVFKIDIVGPDNAAVVASLVEDHRWRFTTVHTPWSGDHPVCGHREFGVRSEANGAVVVYTRGADRATDGLGETIVFFGADRLWKSFQSKLVDWIGAHGGSASAPEPFSQRFHPSVVDILYGHGTVAQALDNQSYSIHWDTVPYYPQQTDASCWAASAAMVVGWRDGTSLADADIAAKVPALDAYRNGLWPSDRHMLADVWNLVPEPPACYTVDAWRSMLERYGPLYLDMTNSAGTGGHAWVLVGMTSDGAPDGSDTVMYLHNPTASRGRVKWNFQDFQGLYEGRVATEGSTLEYQILHAAAIPAGRRPATAAPFSLGLATDVKPMTQRPALRAVRTVQSGGVHPLGTETIEYPVQLVPQPNKLACWAASMVMLLSFRRNASYAPETLANEVGGSLMTSYSWDLLQAVRDRYGFTAIAVPSNTSLYFSPTQWAQWLRDFGPLWVVIVGMPHAVVVSGLRGNTDDASACEVKLLNPWDTRVTFDGDPTDFHPANAGYADWLPFQQFASDFGNMAEADYGNWRVLHLPAPATAQGLSTAVTQRRGSAARSSYLAVPPQRVRAASLEDTAPAAEPIEPSRVAGTTMRRQRGSRGRATWALDQLDGVKLPDPAAAMVPALVPTTITLDQWPCVGRDAVPLPLTVRFDAGGGALGNVRIAAGTAADLPYDVTVTATIEDDAQPLPGMTSPHAALRVTVDYDFTGTPNGDASARVKLRLVGNGRYDLDANWQ